MTFDPDVAESMRDLKRGDEDAAVAFLAELAGGGPALELGIGTGRIALPLAATGMRVDGIDISPHCIEQLRAKPGGDRINVTLGDFANVPVEGAYRLIYVPWNSFFNLLTQEDEVRCFENVAKHLTDDGSFVIEGGMSAEFLYSLREYQYVQAEIIEVDEVRIDVLRIDPVTQMLDESHVTLSPKGIRLNPVMQRYAWPAELDLMARIAGLRLKERWGGWDKRPWTAHSHNVVSVWGR
jgi:SAM-dependent methyltransferase